MDQVLGALRLKLVNRQNRIIELKEEKHATE